jgi:hypothetical protein
MGGAKDLLPLRHMSSIREVERHDPLLVTPGSVLRHSFMLAFHSTPV